MNRRRRLGAAVVALAIIPALTRLAAGHSGLDWDFVAGALTAVALGLALLAWRRSRPCAC
jgi:hypothetical protein